MRLFFFLFAFLLAVPAIWPTVDLIASGFFYRPGDGFYLAANPIFVSLHWLAYYGARVMGVGFAILALYSKLARREIRGLNSRAWFFLLLSLIIAPGLIANAGFKDHWGRARPREVIEFGGSEAFSPALEPQPIVRSNGSFVSGDGAFGFFLPAFAYVVSRRSSRRVFWSAMLAGGVFSFARLVMGAHFLSDIIYAAFMMLMSIAVVHAAMYGRSETMARWRSWFIGSLND